MPHFIHGDEKKCNRRLMSNPNLKLINSSVVFGRVFHSYHFQCFDHFSQPKYCTQIRRIMFNISTYGYNHK